MDDRLLIDEEGYALVLAIMMLAVLMIAGVIVSNTSVTDLGATRNTVVYSQNAAAAESAAMAAVQILENESADSTNLKSEFTGWSWLLPDDADESDSAYDSSWGTLAPMSSLTSRFQREGASLRYRVLGWKPVSGAAKGEGAETLKMCIVKGVYSSPRDGSFTVELGFVKGFK